MYLFIYVDQDPNTKISGSAQEEADPDQDLHLNFNFICQFTLQNFFLTSNSHYRTNALVFAKLVLLCPQANTSLKPSIEPLPNVDYISTSNEHKSQDISLPQEMPSKPTEMPELRLH
jgi:hypothetical protein